MRWRSRSRSDLGRQRLDGLRPEDLMEGLEDHDLRFSRDLTLTNEVVEATGLEVIGGEVLSGTLEVKKLWASVDENRGWAMELRTQQVMFPGLWDWMVK